MADEPATTLTADNEFWSFRHAFKNTKDNAELAAFVLRISLGNLRIGRPHFTTAIADGGIAQWRSSWGLTTGRPKDFPAVRIANTEPNA